MELILLALQSNSTGSVLIDDGRLGVGIKELKPGAAAPIAEFRMHRTKCLSIKNVPFKHFKDDLLADNEAGKFSLLIDESNDISILKLLCVFIIYYSKLQKKIVTTYLWLVELMQCDAKHIGQS